jgi:hypothetical protein
MAALEELRCEAEQKVKNYFPEALLPLKAGLAVVAINSFKHNQQPIALIFSGPSGSGKTFVLSFLSPSQTKKLEPSYIFRCDNFTPRSFVTHAANISREQLEKIDLLPKIENKTLLTKELAPLFRGKKQELIQTFSVLISVLDGRGYISASGSQGMRGYDKQINFTWLGATTPLSNESFRMMAQLGTRLMFYDTTRKEKGIDALLEFAKRKGHFQHEIECQEVVNEFLIDFFKQHPPRSFDETQMSFADTLLRKLCVFAKLMARLRAAYKLSEGANDVDGNVDVAPMQENEERAIIILKNIALGSALMEQRDHVSDFDILQIEHIALSSCPEPRRKIFNALIDCGGEAVTDDLLKKTGYSQPTCIHYMKELQHLRVIKYSGNAREFCVPIRIEDEFSELVKYS